MTAADPPGVSVLGFLREAKGIGEAGRLYAEALAAAGVPVRTGALDAGHTPVADAGHAELGELGASDAHPTNLLCLNAPELQRLVESGATIPPARRDVGVWAWEVDRVPASWPATSALLDEVWVYSRFTADILGPALRAPVHVAPLPVRAPAALAPDPRTGDAFSFLFLFDFHSMLERKNPLALIEAFTRAFAPREGPRLVVKSFNGDRRPEDLERVRAAAGGRPDVLVIDEYVDRAGRDALIAGCDCYVSLHRAEGYGLTLAEAMAAGKPVVATGYSGNLDFMDDETGYLVDWSPVAVPPGVQEYPEGAGWAEPDVEHAAAILRRVFAQREEASARAARGRARVLERLSPEAVGRALRERLEAAADPSPASRLVRRLRRRRLPRAPG